MLEESLAISGYTFAVFTLLSALCTPTRWWRNIIVFVAQTAMIWLGIVEGILYAINTILIEKNVTVDQVSTKIVLAVLAVICLWWASQKSLFDVPSSTAIGTENSFWSRKDPTTGRSFLNWYLPGKHYRWFFESNPISTDLRDSEPIILKDIQIETKDGRIIILTKLVFSYFARIGLIDTLLNLGKTSKERHAIIKSKLEPWFTELVRVYAVKKSVAALRTDGKGALANWLNTEIRKRYNLDDLLGVYITDVVVGEYNDPPKTAAGKDDAGVSDMILTEAAKIKGKLSGMSDREAWNAAAIAMNRAELVVGAGSFNQHSNQKGGKGQHGNDSSGVGGVLVHLDGDKE